jgi:8-oxo-dGTP pyrophosphatase MutT (NUDIX family)
LVTNQIGTVTFPKGTLEAEETYEEAAIREVLEESGLRKVELIKWLGWISRQGFKTEKGRTRPVTKRIGMFLFHTQEFELNPEVADISSAMWVAQHDVAGLLHWQEEAQFYEDHRLDLEP